MYIRSSIVVESSMVVDCRSRALPKLIHMTRRHREAVCTPDTISERFRYGTKILYRGHRVYLRSSVVVGCRSRALPKFICMTQRHREAVYTPDTISEKFGYDTKIHYKGYRAYLRSSMFVGCCPVSSPKSTT